MDEIINNVQNNWSKDIIIRYLYIKLAPYFKRDLKYFLASFEDKEKLYNLGFINRFPDVVCSTLADFYVKLFQEFDINAKKIIANSSKIPLFALIVEGDNGWYFLNPLEDLFNNQYNLKPVSFGIIPRFRTIKDNYPYLTLLPQEYLASLDDYLQLKYLDDYFQKMHKIFTNRVSANLFLGYPKNSHYDLKEDKVNYYEKFLINLGNVNGCFERAQLYQYLNDIFLTKAEKRFVKVIICGNISKPYIFLQILNKDCQLMYKEEVVNDKYILAKIK